MKYARITLTVAFEDYGVETLSALDHVLPTLRDDLSPEVTVLEFDERPMMLRFDYAAEMADQ